MLGAGRSRCVLNPCSVSEVVSQEIILPAGWGHCLQPLFRQTFPYQRASLCSAHQWPCHVVGSRTASTILAENILREAMAQLRLLADVCLH